MSKIRLPARIEYLETLIQFVSAYAREKGFAHERITQIELATEEALVNIFKYAYPEDIGEVELTCKMDNDKFIIKIVDAGVPFDIESVPEPDLTADISNRKIGGLGIFVIRKMVDELHYHREDDKNILIFILYQRKEK